MARRRKKEEVQIELDSFLDILTNAIGIIIVITVMAILNSAHMTFIFRTPFVQKTEKTALLFECRNKRVAFIDKANLHEQLEAYRRQIKKQGLTELQLRRKLQSEQYKIEDTYYQADLAKFINDDLEVFIPKEDQQGENIHHLGTEDAEFKSLARQIDPQVNFAFFLVRPDSYRVFRKARKILWDLGVQVGWEPLSLGQQIIFGSKGRRAVID